MERAELCHQAVWGLRGAWGSGVAGSSPVVPKAAGMGVPGPVRGAGEVQV